MLEVHTQGETKAHSEMWQIIVCHANGRRSETYRLTRDEATELADQEIQRPDVAAVSGRKVVK